MYAKHGTAGAVNLHPKGIVLESGQLLRNADFSFDALVLIFPRRFQGAAVFCSKDIRFRSKNKETLKGFGGDNPSIRSARRRQLVVRKDMS